MSRLLLLP